MLQNRLLLYNLDITSVTLYNEWVNKLHKMIASLPHNLYFRVEAATNTYNTISIIVFYYQNVLKLQLLMSKSQRVGVANSLDKKNKIK